VAVQIERIAIGLRARNGWEAIDLGFRMAMRWAGPLWRVWFLLFLPVSAVLLLAFREQPLLAALAIWWLLPVFDRFLLHVLAHAVFGSPPRLVDTLGAWRQCLGNGLWQSLLLRPLAWNRCFLAPMRQLEGQRGPAARRRARLLGRRILGHAFALGLVCLLFELMVMLGAGVLLHLLQPGGFLAEAVASDEAELWEPAWWGIAETLSFALAVSVIEPLFVAAGFALYLNRRVLLEGWDIELALRRLQRRSAAGSALVLLALALGLAAPATAVAAGQDGPCAGEVEACADPFDPAFADALSEADPGRPPDVDAASAAFTPLDTEARRRIVAVLASGDFGGTRVVQRWRPIQREEEREVDGAWLAPLGRALATLLKLLAWLLLAVLALAMVWAVLRQWRQGMPTDTAGKAPDTLFGLAISPDSLPSDVAAAAQAALQRGRPREALSLLYRGALSELVHGRAVAVGKGATEGDVLALVQRCQPAPVANWFRRLLPLWVDLAYAHREPPREPLVRLCTDYRQCFGPGETAATP